MRRSRTSAVLLLAAAALILSGPATPTVVASPVVAAATPDPSFTITGSGWGHGVGMSQWGARGMAATGSSAPEILGHYYRGTALQARSTSDDLRVLVAWGTPTLTLETGGRTTFDGVAVVPAAGRTVRLERVGSAIRLTGALEATVGSSIRIRYAGDSDLRVAPPGHRYRHGALRVSIDPAGGLRAVVEGLGMQQYLYGLGEMPSSWPAAALQAQAIAGRTFAQKRRDARSGADFDLYGAVPHQSYTGTTHAAPAWVAAVDATDGQVVTHGGALIDALYSASSGGHTEDSEFVWVSALPYLRGVPDPHDGSGGNPHASWSHTLTGAQLGDWFDLGTVSSVEVLGRLGVSGRVDKATIRLTGTAGTRDVSGSSFRSTVNSRASGSPLRSTRFAIDGSAVPPPPPPPPVRPPSGSYDTALAEGRRVVIAGRAGDPDGAPVVRMVSTMGSERAVRTTRATNGTFRFSWIGRPGTRRVCVEVLDTPTNQTVGLGCRDVVVK